jgi:hypothetical protein
LLARACARFDTHPAQAGTPVKIEPQARPAYAMDVMVEEPEGNGNK